MVLPVIQESITDPGSCVLTTTGYGSWQNAAGDFKHALRVVPSSALTRKPAAVHWQVLLVALYTLLATSEQFTGTRSCKQQETAGGGVTPGLFGTCCLMLTQHLQNAEG